MANVIPKMTDPTETVKNLMDKIGELSPDEFQLNLVELLLAERKLTFDVCHSLTETCEQLAIADRDDYPHTGGPYHLRDGAAQMAAGIKETIFKFTRLHVYGDNLFPKEDG